MKRRTFIRNLTAGVAVPATVAGTSLLKPALTHKKIEWTMVTYFRVKQKHQEFAKILAEASQGQFLIKLSSRGSDSACKVIEDINSGRIEMGYGSFLFSPTEKESETRVQKVPAADFLIMPFGLTAQEYNAWIEFGGGFELVSKIYAQIGCKYFPAGNTGIQMGGWFAKEINAVDDLKGLKIRISGFGAEAMKALGAEPYDVAPWSDDTKRAMKSGKLDAFELGRPSSDLANELHKQYKYYYYPAWHEPSVPRALIINRAKWDALPSHLKAIISTAARWLNDQDNIHIVDDAEALETLVKEHGVQLRLFPEPVLKELARVSYQIMSERASQDKLSQEVFDSIMMFRKKVSLRAEVVLQPYLTARGSI
jgi:TRAP-type mannitol/chloroaromatic compound transport system substrate-binding protein